MQQGRAARRGLWSSSPRPQHSATRRVTHGFSFPRLALPGGVTEAVAQLGAARSPVFWWLLSGAEQGFQPLSSSAFGLSHLLCLELFCFTTFILANGFVLFVFHSTCSVPTLSGTVFYQTLPTHAIITKNIFVISVNKSPDTFFDSSQLSLKKKQSTHLSIFQSHVLESGKAALFFMAMQEKKNTCLID